MASPLKSGFLQRYSRKFMQEGWKSIWCVLYSDSTFAWYKHQSDRTPKGQVNLKVIAQFFAVGAYATRIPNAPRVDQNQANLLLALPDKPSRDAFVEFFMAAHQPELDEWMAKIVSTLPPPPQQSAPPPAAHPAAYPAQSPYPGPPAGGMPQPDLGFGGPPPPQAYPPQGAYPQAPMGYPPQQAQGAYPQQPYPQQQQGYSQQHGAYPQQHGAYPQQHGAYPQQHGAYPQQTGAYPQPPGYSGYPAAGAAAYGAQQPSHQVVYVNGKPKKKKILGMNQKTAAGLAGGAAAGYMLGRVTGGGFGGFGHGLGGGWGSWSSLSSFGSCGSFGSF